MPEPDRDVLFFAEEREEPRTPVRRRPRGDRAEAEHDRVPGRERRQRCAADEEDRAEAAQVAAESRERLDALQREAQALSEVIAERRNEFAEMLQSALDRIGIHERAAGGETETELTTVLRSRVTDAQTP